MLKRKKIYILGEFTLDPDRRLLIRHGTSIHLTQKPFRVLLYLIEHRDRVVSRAELLDQFWEGHDVYDDSVRKAVGAIRKALDDRNEQAKFIETIYGEGFRYVGPLKESPPEEGSSKHSFPTDLVMEVTGKLPDDFGTVTSAPQADEPNQSIPAVKLRRFHKRHFIFVVTVAVCFVVLGIILVWRAYDTQTDIRARSIPSVAVLPFRNLSGNPADEYFSDGLTNHLINTLTKVEGLKVSARGSTFTLKGQELDPQEAGRRLGVAAVLQGSVFKRERRVRVGVRLVSVADGQVLWAKDTGDRALNDVFSLQDELARDVLSGLRVDLKAGKERRLIKRYTESEEAYQAYLKGRYHWYLRTPEVMIRSFEYFQEAIRLDPNFAPAYTGLADYYSLSVWFRVPPTGDLAEKAKAAARRALELDEGLAEAHVSMARAYALEMAVADSARELERALEIAPDNAEAHHYYAYILLALEQPDRAVDEIKRARELDPLSVVMNVDVGEVLLYARRYDEAVAALHHAIEIDPKRENAHWDLAVALQKQGQDAEAFEAFMRSEVLKGKPSEMIRSYREEYSRSGLSGFWRQYLKDEEARSDPLPPYLLAQFSAQAGERDKAFSYLEQAYRERSPFLFNLKFDPLLDPLRDNPRFPAFIARAEF